MTKNYTIRFSIAVSVIILLQIMYFFSLYENFSIKEHEKIENYLYQAIDLELHSRNIEDKPEVKYDIEIKSLDDYTKEEQDSLIRKLPFLATKPQVSNKYNIPKLVEDGYIRTSGDLTNQQRQDLFYKTKTPVDIVVLDSIFNAKLKEGYISSVYLITGADSLVTSNGNKEFKYNHETKLIKIGLNDFQTVYAKVFIPKSSFIKQSILILILTILTMLVPVYSLVYFVTTLRRRDEEISEREISVSGIIHDLKSPLSTVNAALDYFRMSDTDEDTQDFIKLSKKSISNLTFRIESLLNISQSCISKITPHLECIKKQKVDERIDTVLQELKQIYKNKIININVSNELKEDCYIDLQHLNSIIANLVENSIKYSDKNVNIDVRLKHNNGDELIIDVKDDGFGIAKHNHKKIFNHHQRGEHKNIKGYGVGLAYLRHIARAHNGKILLVKSEIGKGSHFRVILKSPVV